jgi:hypothetical protein
MPSTGRDYKPIVKLLERNTGARRMVHVFDDFVEMFAISFRNSVDKRGWQEREDQYLRIAGKYDKEQLGRFAEAFALVVQAMEAEPRDVLGHLYMSLDLGNEAMGQFYTPYDIARLMADMQGKALTRQVEERGFAEIYEPACGAGAFMVAASEAFKAKGFNPQTQLHVTAEDLSAQAVHMIYIHLTLLHIPAVVCRRNTLSMETFDTWYTPAHILGGWSRRLRQADAVGSARELLESLPVVEQIEQANAAWEDVFEGV